MCLTKSDQDAPGAHGERGTERERREEEEVFREYNEKKQHYVCQDTSF